MKSNILFIGTAVFFISLALIQVFTPDMLPMSIYVFIAFASLELAFLELIKTIAKSIKYLHMDQIRLLNDELDLCNQTIEIFNGFCSLEEIVEYNQNYRIVIESKISKTKSLKRVKILDAIIKLLTGFQVIFLFVQLALSLTKFIPNNLISNKTIGVLGLLSFSVVLISYFVTITINDMRNDNKQKIHISKTLSNYYLGLLERVSKDEEKQ